MPPGTGRGDGDEGSPTNPHIGYLEITNNGEKVIKPYLRTSNEGRKVRPNSLVDYDQVNYYKLVPITGKELTDIQDEEHRDQLTALARRDAYIKVVRIKKSSGGWLNSTGF